jgi:hypothetical protein
MSDINPARIMGAVAILWEGTLFLVLNEWNLRTRLWVRHRGWIVWACVVIFVVAVAAIGFAVFPFGWEVVEQAADITVHSTFSTSYPSIVRDILVGLYVLLRPFSRTEGVAAVRKRFDSAKDTLTAVAVAFLLTGLYNLVVKIPDNISAKADVNHPVIPLGKTRLLPPQGWLPPRQDVRLQQPLVNCRLPDDGSPCELNCSINNKNQVAVRDVALGLIGPLPAKTRIAAAPDTRIEMVKPDTLPVPNPNGQVMSDLRSLTIKAPIVAPNSEVSFSLWTDDSDNKRACQQLLGMEHKRREAMKEFFRRALAAGDVKASQVPAADDVYLALAKNADLFQVSVVTSEIGRESVHFKTSTEDSALKKYELVQRVSQREIGVFNDGGECMAPVFRYEQNGWNLYRATVICAWREKQPRTPRKTAQ